MIIHANGGNITVEITDDCITMNLTDIGPGIENVEAAMQKDTQPPMRIFVQWASAKVWDLLI